MDSKNKPQISVIIPAYNEENYLPRLLDSLKKQTLEWGKDFEVLVVDGGSRDRTPEIAKSNGAVLIREYGGAQGPGNARNRGARAARGNTLIFLDADVVALPALVESLHKRVSAGASVATAYAIPDDRKYALGTAAMNIFFNVMTSLGIPHVAGYCMAVRRDVFMSVGGFDTSVKIAEDHLFAKAASSHGPVSFIRKPLLVVSTRRISRNGVWFALYQFIYTFVHLLFGVPIREFSYEFGIFS